MLINQLKFITEAAAKNSKENIGRGDLINSSF